MRRARTLGTIAIAGSALVWLAGCGDDAEQITKPDFIVQANATCQEVQDQVDVAFEAVWAEFEDVDENDPAVQERLHVVFAETMDAVVPAWHQLADDLRDLGAPAGDEELLSKLFDDLDTAVDEFAAMTDAAAAGDVAAREYLDGQGEEVAIDVVNRRAQDYGLDVCGAGS